MFVPSHHFPLPPSSKDEQLCKGVAVLQLNCFEKMKEVGVGYLFRDEIFCD